MARIVLADDGIEFDGTTLDHRPLGGAESGVIGLMECLAARGHDVSIHNRCGERHESRGVRWYPIGEGLPEAADLYIANRGAHLIPLVPLARHVAFWTHNPAGYMLKWRYFRRLLWRRPFIIFIGEYHAATYPAWAPGGRRVIMPYGTPDAFCEAQPASDVPGPRAVFTSNPTRSLDWLLQRWEQDIAPRVPGAELHVYGGTATYGSMGVRKAGDMNAILDRAAAMEALGVRVKGAVGKAKLIEALREARAMLYRGDTSETFCMSVAEAQAMGVPAVTQDIGSMRERIVHGETGYVTGSDAEFSEAAVKLLSDDALWRAQHDAALARREHGRWPEAAAKIEALIT